MCRVLELLLCMVVHLYICLYGFERIMSNGYITKACYLSILVQVILTGNICIVPQGWQGLGPPIKLGIN